MSKSTAKPYVFALANLATIAESKPQETLAKAQVAIGDLPHYADSHGGRRAYGVADDATGTVYVAVPDAPDGTPRPRVGFSAASCRAAARAAKAVAKHVPADADPDKAADVLHAAAVMFGHGIKGRGASEPKVHAAIARLDSAWLTRQRKVQSKPAAPVAPVSPDAPEAPAPETGETVAPVAPEAPEAPAPEAPEAPETVVTIAPEPTADQILASVVDGLERLRKLSVTPADAAMLRDLLISLPVAETV
jgi:hypothetical protein